MNTPPTDLDLARRLALLTALRHLVIAATDRGHTVLALALHRQIQEEGSRRGDG